MTYRGEGVREEKNKQLEGVEMYTPAARPSGFMLSSLFAESPVNLFTLGWVYV